MAKQQTNAGRRYCEECGRPIESKDPDVFLCGRCAQAAEEAAERSKRAERDMRKRQRAQREAWTESPTAARTRDRSDRHR